MRKVVTFTDVDGMIDAPVSGIVVLNDDDEILNVDIAGITRDDLPDGCEITAEDNDGNVYTEWGIPE